MVAFKYNLHPMLTVTAIVGGLFPDTDTRKSLLGRWIPLWLLFKPHRRNLLHSLLGAVIFSVPWLYISYSSAILFFLGYLSHLILDMCNKTGIPLWYPNKHMISIAKVKIGGFGELLLAIAFYIMVVALLNL